MQSHLRYMSLKTIFVDSPDNPYDFYVLILQIGWYNLQEFIDYGLIHRHESSEIDTLMTLLECLGTGLKGQCKIEYETMYSSPWASHLDIEEEHKEINQVFLQ